jgi:hypothetical protein
VRQEPLGVDVACVVIVRHAGLPASAPVAGMCPSWLCTALRPVGVCSAPPPGPARGGGAGFFIFL